MVETHRVNFLQHVQQHAYGIQRGKDGHVVFHGATADNRAVAFVAVAAGGAVLIT
jgi:hypothetical protein